jgi:DNA-binding transcriptional ArsR family regulator
MLRLVPRRYFDYRKSMDVRDADARISAVASAIAEPARTHMLCRLLDGCARTGTELAIVAGVSPSTASIHLAKLAAQNLVKVTPQGRHRYYSLCDGNVAAALEALIRVAGAQEPRFEPRTPDRLRSARTCYDHMAGRLAVALHDRLLGLHWLSVVSPQSSEVDYDVTRKGAEELARLGVDVTAARAARRRFACGCLDWSERRPHLAGALGAALLASTLRLGWVTRDLDSRALGVTRKGQRALRERFGVEA